MGDSRKYRLLIWAVVLLLICNIGLVLTLWLKPPQQGGPHREPPRNFVISNLGFSDEQVSKYDVLIEAHQDAMRRLRREAMTYRQTLFNGLKGNNNTAVNADSLAQRIAVNQKEIEVVTYEHFRQVRMLCTADQMPKFDAIIGDVIKRMNGHGGPPPRDGKHNGPPEERNGPPPPPDGR